MHHVRWVQHGRRFGQRLDEEMRKVVLTCPDHEQFSSQYMVCFNPSNSFMCPPLPRNGAMAISTATRPGKGFGVYAGVFGNPFGFFWQVGGLQIISISCDIGPVQVQIPSKLLGSRIPIFKSPQTQQDMVFVDDHGKIGLSPASGGMIALAPDLLMRQWARTA